MPSLPIAWILPPCTACENANEQIALEETKHDVGPNTRPRPGRCRAGEAHCCEVWREPLEVSGREQGKQMIARVVAGHGITSRWIRLDMPGGVFVLECIP